MKDDEARQILNEIGNLLMKDEDYSSENTLLYAQLDYNSVSESIFKELGNQILYRDPVNKDLPYVLLDLWEIPESDKRWAEMEYVYRDGQFQVTYIYADEIDPEDDFFERRDRAVRRHLGEKPIVYPPWPEDGVPNYDL